MSRAKLLISIVPAILALTGCGAPRPVMYYTVQIPAVPAPVTYLHPIEVTVGTIDGPDLLEALPIVYKTGQNQIATYQYHRWTEAPVQMAQSKLIRLLRASGGYRSIGSSRTASRSDLMLRGRLYEFEEVDGDGISGLVTLEFELYNRKTARTVWSHFYSQTEPVETKKVPAVVQALDRNLDRGLKEVVAGLARYFAENPPEKLEAPSQPDEMREGK